MGLPTEQAGGSDTGGCRMKQVEITSKVVGRGESEGITSAIPSINLSGFALKSDLLTLEKKFSDFLNVPIIDGTINRWNELETFLAGISEDYNLLSLLNGKADKSYVDTNFVTIAGTEDVTGLHDFVNGLKIGGLPITKKQDDVVYLDANLVVRGGITMYAENEVDIPSILDSLPIANANTQDKASKGIASFDSAYFKVTDGWVTLTSAPSSGASYLGELLNVDSSIDATASVDRVLYQPAGSAMWTWRELPKDGVVGNYLPLSGGTLTASVAPQLKIVNNGYTDAYITMTGSNGYSAHAGMVELPTTGHAASFGYSERIVFPVTGGMYYRNGYDGDNQVILHAGNYSSYALPLSGGTINGSGSYSAIPLVIKNSNSQFNGLSIYANTTERVHLGYWSSLGGVRLENVACGSGFAILNDGTPSYYKINSNGTFAKNTIAFTDSNVASATKLQTPRTIWGQSFDGSGDVNGNIIANEYHAPTPSGGKYPKFRLISDQDSDSTWLQSANAAGTSASGILTLSGMYGKGLALCKILGPLLVTHGITMYSDQRKKTILNNVELSLKQIADAPLIEHYYNSDQNKTTHVGSIAQYWAELNDWFCKLDNEGFYTMEIQNCALASAISIARHLEKYESKTDKKIRMLKKRVQELEDKLERLDGGKYGCN